MKRAGEKNAASIFSTGERRRVCLREGYREHCTDKDGFDNCLLHVERTDKVLPSMGHPQDKVKVVRGRGMAILIADSRANEGDQVWGDVGPTSKIAN